MLENLNSINQDKNDYFDVNALPDMDEHTENVFIDFINKRKEEDKVEKKECFDIKNEPVLEEDDFRRNDGKVLELHFEISKKDLKMISGITNGIITSDLTKGCYVFEVDTQDNGQEDIYYFGEYVGEIFEGKPKVYRRFFGKAVFRSLVLKEILEEYEPGQFRPHPNFMAGLQPEVAEQLLEQFNKSKRIKINRDKLMAGQKVQQPNQENKQLGEDVLKKINTFF